MNKKSAIFTLSGLLITSLAIWSSAEGAGTSGGLILLQGTGARAAALGESFSAASDDIAAFDFNPASLNSLNSGHASFQFQQGLADDSFGRLMMGTPFKNAGLGLSIGYYNGGEFEIFEENSTRSVTAKRDLAVSIGAARQMGIFSLGAAGKYLSSELAETAKANAFAVDLGVQMKLTSHLNFGMAAQNFGTQLKFEEQGDDLPRVVRTGMALNFAPGGFPSNVMLDIPYFMNEKEINPTVGIETYFGPVAVRAGYKSGTDLEGFTVGSGFLLGRASLDYAFGLVDELDSKHKVSFALRFGGAPVPPVFVNKPGIKTTLSPKPYETIEDPELQKAIKKDQEALSKLKTKEAEKPEEKAESSAPENTPKRLVTPVATQAERAAVEAAKRKPATPQKKVVRRPNAYVVKHGDTLESIAQKFYGSSKKWVAIYDLNEDIINNPAIIDLVGQRLKLP